MDSGTEGPHRLAAVLAAFRLINTALRFDEDAAAALNSLTVRERVAPLHMQLINPQHRLAVLLQYVLYNNMDLQHEVIQFLSFWHRQTLCASSWQSSVVQCEPEHGRQHCLMPST